VRIVAAVGWAIELVVEELIVIELVLFVVVEECLGGNSLHAPECQRIGSRVGLFGG
jgi:hypothetical protein